MEVGKLSSVVASPETNGSGHERVTVLEGTAKELSVEEGTAEVVKVSRTSRVLVHEKSAVDLPNETDSLEGVIMGPDVASLEMNSVGVKELADASRVLVIVISLSTTTVWVTSSPSTVIVWVMVL